jgi:hypothetical protein
MTRNKLSLCIASTGCGWLGAYVLMVKSPVKADFNPPPSDTVGEVALIYGLAVKDSYLIEEPPGVVRALYWQVRSKSGRSCDFDIYLEERLFDANFKWDLNKLLNSKIRSSKWVKRSFEDPVEPKSGWPCSTHTRVTGVPKSP